MAFKFKKSDIISAIKTENYGEIRKFVDNINFLEIKNLYDVASYYNKCDVLEFMYRLGLSFNDVTFTNDSLNFASFRHYENVLNWWLKMCKYTDLKYDNIIIDDASCNGDMWVLNWWFNSGLELVYTTNAIDDASINNKIEILNWWYNKRNYIEFKYTNLAVDFANTDNVLTWWILRFGNDLNFSNFLQNASNNHNIKILNCWEDAYTAGYITDLKITKKIISRLNRLDILKWIMDSKLVDDNLKDEVNKSIIKQKFEINYSQKFVNEFKFFKKYFNDNYFLQKSTTKFQLTHHIVMKISFKEKPTNNTLELIEILSKSYFFICKKSLSKISNTNIKKNISKTISKNIKN